MKTYMTPENCGDHLCQGKYTYCQGIMCSLWNWVENGFAEYSNNKRSGFGPPPEPVWHSLPSTKGYCGLNKG